MQCGRVHGREAEEARCSKAIDKLYRVLTKIVMQMLLAQDNDDEIRMAGSLENTITHCQK